MIAPATRRFLNLRALASLRLTVVLFVLSMALVFFGTLAQIDNGIWTVVSAYFRSFFVPEYQVRTEKIEFVVQSDKSTHEFVFRFGVHQFIVLLGRRAVAL